SVGKSSRQKFPLCDTTDKHRCVPSALLRRAVFAASLWSRMEEEDPGGEKRGEDSEQRQEKNKRAGKCPPGERCAIAGARRARRGIEVQTATHFPDGRCEE